MMARYRLVVLGAAILGVSFLTQDCSCQEKEWVGKRVDFGHGQLVVSENLGTSTSL